MTTETTTTTTTSTETKRRGRPSKLSPAKLQRAIEEYNKGKTPKQIVAMKWFHGGDGKAIVSEQTLYQHMAGLVASTKESKIQMRPKGRPGLSPEQATLVVRLAKEGKTLTEIQDHKDLIRAVWTTEAGSRKKNFVKFSLPTLSAAVKAAGIVLPRGRRANKEPKTSAVAA